MSGRRGDYGSLLLGGRFESRRRRRIRTTILLAVGSYGANLVALGLALLLVTVGIPEPSIFEPSLRTVNEVLLPTALGVGFVMGHVRGVYVVWSRLRWVTRSELPPTEAEARRTLSLPGWLTFMQLSIWLLGAALFGILYGAHELRLVPKIVGVITLSGFVVCGVVFQLAELSMRPITAIVLRSYVPPKRQHGLLVRSVGSWLLGSGLPLIGMILIMVFAVTIGDVTIVQLAVSVLVLSAMSVATGLTLTLLNLSRITGPLRSVIDGMREVEQGRFDAEVSVYDPSTLGALQAGFNAMAAGLRERELVRDLYNRQVGEQVARATIESRPELGGVERTVAVVFIDLVGSTTLAATRRASEVVTILNRFCGVVVEEVNQRGGLVNKFEGDAVLAIFGAPTELPDPAGAALEAARVMTARVAVEVEEIRAGCGVSFGVVVAGYVGAADRFEYTVIGDPVNEAARLSSAAKEDPTVPWVSQTVVDAASPAEAQHWHRGPVRVLRGRVARTQIYLARS
ncbi:adenylate/guanylate cyclase domain-containing protein [Tsukamurella soli]|uniref:Adenylate/guanylate cyclase domain-containing protein n=1 Tax=Tsukamurella soli TaxID=644556 RepID=A0ABP8JCL7_9ACTN